MAHQGKKRYVALYCRSDSPYKNRSHFDVYDKERNALTYKGPLPVVAHPPCRTWGKLKHMALRNVENAGAIRHKEQQLALHALEQVYKWGGVLEHPRDSVIWKLIQPHMDNCQVLELNQYDYGHVASKPTNLLVYPKVKIPTMEMPKLRPPRINVAAASINQREKTPEKMIDFIEEILHQISFQITHNNERSRSANR